MRVTVGVSQNGANCFYTLIWTSQNYEAQDNAPAVDRNFLDTNFYCLPYLPTCGVSLKDLYWLKPRLQVFIVMSTS